MQQEVLEGGKGLYISSNSLNNASDFIRMQIQSQHRIPKLAVQDDIEKTELQGKIEMVDNQIHSQHKTLECLLEDAINQAKQDGVILLDAQLRNVV